MPALAVQRRCVASLAAALGLLVAGCGAERQVATVGGPAAEPQGIALYASPDGDVRFQRPANWTVVDQTAPGVATIVSGEAVVAVFAYRRDAVPTAKQDREEALDALRDELGDESQDFRVSEGTLRRVGDLDAVEAQGTGTVGSRKVTLRSVHAFDGNGEYVIEAYAPPKAFKDLDRTVFEPLIDSLKVRGDPVEVPADATETGG
ncbi:MAG: hypothetical protein ACR2NA_13725 [Solirubrobacterales bacterium]